jgi:hypothetical protein
MASVHDVQYEARQQWDQEHKKPEWEQPDMPAPDVIKHSNGRLWLEVQGNSYPNQGSLAELHITFGAEAKSVTLRVDQLRLLLAEADHLIIQVGACNDAKDQHNAAVKQWEADKAAFVEQTVKDWRKGERAEKKAAKG